jgi:hypothetical protein
MDKVQNHNSFNIEPILADFMHEDIILKTIICIKILKQFVAAFLYTRFFFKLYISIRVIKSRTMRWMGM